MKVTCSRCGTEYNFDDSKVTEEGVKVKCTRCDNVFRVRKKAYAITEPVGGGGAAVPTDANMPIVENIPSEPSSTAPSTFGAAAAGRQWMIRRTNGEKVDFREMTTLQRWIVERRVGPDDEISHNGVKWKRLGAIPELAPFFKVVEDEDAARTAPRPIEARDERITTGEFLASQLDEVREPTFPSFPSAPPTESAKRVEGARGAAPPAESAKRAEGAKRAIDGWDERPTSRTGEGEVDRATRRSGGGRSRRGVVLLGVVALVALGGAWAQLTPSGQETTGPARAWLFTTAGIDLRLGPLDATPSPKPSPTAVAVGGETPAAPVTPVPTETPVATPTEVVVAPTPVTPVPTPSAKPTATKVARAPADVDTLLQQGFEAYSRGRYRDAINKYQAAVNADPANSEAYALLGLAYLDSGNDDLAESSLEAAIRLNPRFADAHRYLGMLYSRRGDKARAIASFNLYLDLRPNGPTSDDVRRRVASLQGGG